MRNCRYGLALAIIFIFVLGIFYSSQNNKKDVKASGNTYYVATSGNNSNPGTLSQPFLTVSYAVTQLTPGDTLYVRGGTYEESLENEIPSGTSWEVPVTVAAYPGETPILKPIAGVDRVLFFNSTGGVDSYIVVDGLALDGTNIDYDVIKITLGSHHIRIKNCEIKNGPQNGILTTQDGSDFNEFIDNNIHNNGDAPGEHGIYISSEDNLIDGNRSYENAESGIKINGNSSNIENNIVRNNIVHDQGTGIMLTVAGPGTQAYNNIVFNNNWGIYVRVGANGVRVYNNTTYKNTQGIYVYETAEDIVVSNNIATENTSYGLYVASTSTNITLSNNLSSNNGTNFEDLGSIATLSNNLIGDEYDAGLTDPDIYDYTLLSTSDAINSGQTIATVTSDIRDNPRPNGSAYDMGAYEYHSVLTTSQSGNSPWTTTNWLSDSGSPIASIYSGIKLGTSLSLGETNHIANSGFDVNTTGWTAVVDYTGNEPDDISDLQLWFKADAIVGVADGGTIGTWPDSSGNGRDAVQATEGLKPTLQTNELNGQPIVRTDGSDDYFSISPAYSVTNDITLYWVEKRDTDSLSDRSVIGRGTTNGDTYLGFNLSGSVHRLSWRIHGQTATNTQLASLISGSSYNIWGLHQSGTTAKLFRNGANGLSASSFTVPSATFDIGYLLARRPNLNLFRGDIAEIIVFNRALNDTEIDEVEAYLNEKYALAITTPFSTTTREYTNIYQGVASATLTATTYNTNFFSSVNPNTSSNLLLRAYVYDSGDAVDATDAQLFHNGTAIATTYTSMGNNWYELSAVVAGSTSATNYGLQVKAGKTLYIDDVRLIQYAESGTLTSSVFDMSQNSQLGTLTYNSVAPTNTSLTVKARSANESDMSDAVDFSNCSSLSSNISLVGTNCVTKDRRYVQYQLVLATSDTSATASLSDISISFTEGIPPTSSTGFGPQDPPDGAIVSDSTPTFMWHKASDASGIAKYQIVLDHNPGNEFGYVDNVNPEKPSNADYRDYDDMYIFYNGNYIQVYTKIESHAIPDGVYRWKVRAEDTNGNTLESGWKKITIDTAGIYNTPSPTPLTSSYPIATIKPVSINSTPTPIPVSYIPEYVDEVPIEYTAPTESGSENEPLKRYRVAIKVIDDSSQPIGGAQVELFSEPRKTTTDTLGMAIFDNVEKGNHTVKVTYDNSVGEQPIEVVEDILVQKYIIQLRSTKPFANKQVQIVIGILIIIIALIISFLLFKKGKANKPMIVNN